MVKATSKSGAGATPLSREAKLERFDAATARQATRNGRRDPSDASEDRGWTRDGLYTRRHDG